MLKSPQGGDQAERTKGPSKVIFLFHYKKGDNSIKYKKYVIIPLSQYDLFIYLFNTFILQECFKLFKVTVKTFITLQFLFQINAVLINFYSC